MKYISSCALAAFFIWPGAVLGDVKLDLRCPAAEPVYGLIIDNGPTVNMSKSNPFEPIQNNAHLAVEDLIKSLAIGDTIVRVPGRFSGKNLLILENINLTDSRIPAGRKLQLVAMSGDVLFNGIVTMKDTGSVSGDVLAVIAENIDQIDCTPNQTNNRPLILYGKVRLEAKKTIGQQSTNAFFQIQQTDLGAIAAESGGAMSLETYAPVYHQFGPVDRGDGISAGGNLSLLLRIGRETSGNIRSDKLVHFSYIP